VTEDDYKKLGLSREIVRRYLDKIAFRRKLKLEQRGNFDEKYPEDPITAFLVAGNQYFDRDILIARKRELVGMRPYQTFSNGQAVLFHPRVPGRRYIIGVDPVRGIEISSSNTDNAAAVVLDLETAEEMAGYCAKVIPQDLAFDIADLGRYYNDALIAVERTGDGGAVILTLIGDCKYNSIYRHKEWHRRDRKIIAFEGFPTTTKTRPVALNMLQEVVTHNPETVWDPAFVDEALVFVRDPKGIPAAAPGAHDDRVLCRAIAHAARKATLGYWDPVSARRESYHNPEQMVASA
jgi:hypothetical protein